MENLILLLLFCFCAFLAGVGISWLYFRLRTGTLENLAETILTKAELEAEANQKKHELSLKHKELEKRREWEELGQSVRRKLAKEEDRLKEREDKLERRMNLVEKKLSDIEKREAVIRGRRSQLEQEKNTIAELHVQLLNDLQKTAGLTVNEAREQLITRISTQVKTDAANITRRAQADAKEEVQRLASTVIATAINRLASTCTSEASIATVTIHGDDIKGRIIGREGRNIRALERATGCDFVIDDTPGVILISCFDPVRKQIAKIALQELIQDGRIHPTRIEEAVEKATQEMERRIKQYGEDAAFRAGAGNLHPELVTLLGKLKFRFSFGQNVLDHSLEVSSLMGVMAAELHLDEQLARRIGLLHDVGKAVSQEIEGPHAIVGHDLALKCGESAAVANGIGAHHYEMEPSSVEALLCIGADTISASRPGARVEALGEYMKRLKRLEEIVHSFRGVERAFVIQAGREVQITVLPDIVDDDQLVNLARDIAQRIQKELSYPGRIKVTLLREKRAVEYAV